MRSPHLDPGLPGKHLPRLRQLEHSQGKAETMNDIYDDPFMDDDEKDLKTLMGMIMRRKLMEKQNAENNRDHDPND